MFHLVPVVFRSGVDKAALTLTLAAAALPAEAQLDAALHAALRRSYLNLRGARATVKGAEELSAHLKAFPPARVELPWLTPESEDRVRVALVLTTRERSALNRNYFNANLWRAAQREAGVEPSRDNGTHALRHWYASVLLDAGESIRAVSEYLGHSDPGFTLRTYTHLMPSSAERTKVAVDTAFAAAREATTTTG